MRAAVIHGQVAVTCDTVDDPKIQNETDFILKVTDTVCGSDLHFYSGGIPPPGAMVSGYEFMGNVEETGKMGTNLKRGDRLVVADEQVLFLTGIFATGYTGIDWGIARAAKSLPSSALGRASWRQFLKERRKLCKSSPGPVQIISLTY